jgi:hypothetical protein
MRPPVFDPAVEIFTRHLRHVQIGQDDVVAAVGEQFERFSTTLYGVDLVSVPPQRKFKKFACIRFILNDQDSVAHSLHLRR